MKRRQSYVWTLWTLLACGLGAGCISCTGNEAMKNLPIVADSEHTINIWAHRGCSYAYPENTLPAFKAACQLPVAGIELDIHLSKDGEVVVIHDETVDRTTNGKGAVADMTLAELQRLDIPYHPRITIG